MRTNRRDDLRAGLEREGVPTAVHYPVPIHRQPAYAQFAGGADLLQSDVAAAEVLSLPMYADMEAETQDSIAAALQRTLAALN